MLRTLKIKSEETFSLFIVASILGMILFFHDVITHKPTKWEVLILKPRVVSDWERIDVPRPIPPKKIIKVEKPKTDIECLASVIYHEARGESFEGQVAVGSVVLNRVKSKHYPHSVCGVVFQPHQFTGIKSIKYNKKAMKVAKKVLSKQVASLVGAATHFHTHRVFPKWAASDKLVYVETVGSHLFYKPNT